MRCNTASEFLQQADSEMKDRAASRDCDGAGERSMGRCVASFNAMFGTNLTVVQGWQFMELLKMARSVGGEYREDDHVDATAYAALAGEAAADQVITDHGADPAYFREEQAMAKQVIPPVEPGSFVAGDHRSQEAVTHFNEATLEEATKLEHTMKESE